MSTENGVRAASLYNSYEFYFGKRKLAFAPWLQALNDALEDEGRKVIEYRHACAWWREGLSVDEALQRNLENLESSQEERSYYDV